MAATCILNDQTLKGEIELLSKGAFCTNTTITTVNSNTVGRSCVRCRGELGRIINRGACCPACRQRVCKSCREYGRPNPTQWLCTLCHKHMELTASTGDWINEYVHNGNKRKNNGINATETIKRSLQRSWTFSDTSPSPWSYLRGSPEMRAYSSMPRHQDCDFLPKAIFKMIEEISSSSKKTVDEKLKHLNEPNNTFGSSFHSSNVKLKTSGGGTDTTTSDTDLGISEISSIESSPLVDKRGINNFSEATTGIDIKKISLSEKKYEGKNIPPGVTPPRSRRMVPRAERCEDETLVYSFVESPSFKSLLPDSKDYKLVFISSGSVSPSYSMVSTTSSPSSSREELQILSDDGNSSSSLSSSSSCTVSSTSADSSILPSSSGFDDCDWDYFTESACLLSQTQMQLSRPQTSWGKKVSSGRRVRSGRRAIGGGRGVESRKGGKVTSSSSTGPPGGVGVGSGGGEKVVREGEKRTLEEGVGATLLPTGSSTSLPGESTQCGSCALPLHVPIPVPVPVPVPVFVPVPWSPPEYRGDKTIRATMMATGRSLGLVERHSQSSPSTPDEEEEDDGDPSSDGDGIVLKLYKALDPSDTLQQFKESHLGDFNTPSQEKRKSPHFSCNDEMQIKKNDEERSSTSSSSSSPPSEDDADASERQSHSTGLYQITGRRANSPETDVPMVCPSETHPFNSSPSSDTTSASQSDVSDNEEIIKGKNHSGSRPQKPKFKRTFVVNMCPDSGDEEDDNVSPAKSDNEKLNESEINCECINKTENNPSAIAESVIEKGISNSMESGFVVKEIEEVEKYGEVNLHPEAEQNLISPKENVTSPQEESHPSLLIKNEVDCDLPNMDTAKQLESPQVDVELIELSSSPDMLLSEMFSSDNNDICVESSLVDRTPSLNVIDSIITFSHVEILQIMAEFLEAERYIFEMRKTIEKMDKQIEAELGPETRSNTSDEFSGTESMEMPLEDSLECGGAAETGQVRASESVSGTVVGESSKETGRYTSLVMITGGSSPPPSPKEEEVKVVTGGGTLSAVVCLEEGLADDDSWVEELDRGEEEEEDEERMENRKKRRSGCEEREEDVEEEEELAAECTTTTTEDSTSEDEPIPDREEELRGYHRSAIDFTLHTIVEESCEESEVEQDKVRPTELEKYFFYGLGDCVSGGGEDHEIDTLSETSSIYSEGLESVGGGEHQSDNSGDPADLASSRLEKYFLNGFMDFRRRDSDGSVGSDSEGKPSPEQRRKRLVRARGTSRQHSSSLDNLTESEQMAEAQPESTSGSSTETDSHDEQNSSFEKNDGQFDTVKRTKKKKRSVTSAPPIELLENPDDTKEDANSDDGKKTPQPEYLVSSELTSRNKQQSRDSGFMGSCDDLLKESRDSPGSDSKLEDEVVTNLLPEPERSIHELSFSSPPTTALTRKDSFNNWSSDEETNLMMSKMRAFFKTMVAAQPKGSSPNVKPKTKPPQLLYFETELTRLMKTVPGIKDEQVKEIVEYLSSEDTWSDSYDSSDYTSSDLESGNKKSALQEEISASCRQIISNFETSNSVEDSILRNGASEISNKDSVYHRLVASFSKMEAPPSTHSASQNSPPLIEKVMQHIGTRLVALMHEVSSGEGSNPRGGRQHHRRSAIQGKFPGSAASTTEEEEDDEEEEVGVRGDYSTVEGYSPLPRSKSHDPLLEESKHEASDNERFSWRGSFESALMASADSRTRLASGGEGGGSSSLAAKRRSAGDLMFKSCSREQLDRVRSCGSIGGSVEDKIWAAQRAARQRQRRSSEGSGGSGAGGDDDDSEAEEGGGDAIEGGVGKSTTLPRPLQPSAGPATNSLPRLPTNPPTPTIYKAHSVHNVKSARYRPPGYRTRGDQRRRPPPSPVQHSQFSSSLGCDDSSICSEPVGRGTEEEVDRIHRTSLGARSDSLASVYSGAGEGRHSGVTVKGEVQFGLQYNYKQSSLEIHVKQCRDLAPVDIKRNRSDPYVKVYLLPDKSKSGKRKTRVKKHTLNPIFEETLRFQVNLDGLETRTLWLSVWHSDMFGRNDFLGEVLMPLENKVFDDPLPKFYTLQERSEPLEELNSKGELIVGLKFVPPEGSGNKKRPSKGCLLVLVKEAKNLPAVKSNGVSDPFCKSYLLPDKGRGSKQKAPVLRRTCNPAWNHTFTYNNISLSELSDRSLELTIWDHDRLASNEFLGGVRLNLGSGKQNGRVVDWMDSSGNEIVLWQRMMERPNFWVESCLPLRPSLDVRKT